MAHSAAEMEAIRKNALNVAAKLFLEKGYTESTVKEIAGGANISVGALSRMFGTKESILCELVKYVLENQFKTATEMVKGKTEDKILFYAAETTLQLYIVESSEQIRELYTVAYSLPKTTEIIQNTITGKLEDVFKEHLPNLETKDFYMLEIASGGIMRGFMTIPCNMWFTMEQKIKSFLETTFLVYRVPDEKIKEAIEFVSQFDYPRIAKELIETMLAYLEGENVWDDKNTGKRVY